MLEIITEDTIPVIVVIGILVFFVTGFIYVSKNYNKRKPTTKKTTTTKKKSTKKK